MIPTHKPAKWQRKLYAQGAPHGWWGHFHHGWPRAWKAQTNFRALLTVARNQVKDGQVHTLVTACQGTLLGAMKPKDGEEVLGYENVRRACTILVDKEDEALSEGLREELLKLFSKSTPYARLMRELIWWMHRPRSELYYRDFSYALDAAESIFSDLAFSFRLRWRRPELR
jgi:hypothetical protein